MLHGHISADGILNYFSTTEGQPQNKAHYSTALFLISKLLIMVGYTNENASSEGNHVTSIETTVILNCSIIALLVPISIVGNVIVLVAIIKASSLRSPCFVLLCSLAVSDLVVGFMAQPLYITSELTKSHLIKLLAESIAYATCGFSLCILTAISVDRFVALYYHMRYTTLVTSSRAIYLSTILFLGDIFLFIIYFQNRNAYLFIMSTAVCICLFISAICYFRIYRIVRRHQVQIHTQAQAVQCSQATTNYLNIAQLKRSAINTFLFYIVTILCYLPVAISLAIYSLSFKSWTNKWNFADTAALMNSSINPFLFCWRLRELRKAVVKTTRQMLCINAVTD